MRHDVMSILHTFCMIAENHNFTRAGGSAVTYFYIGVKSECANWRDELGVNC